MRLAIVIGFAILTAASNVSAQSSADIAKAKKYFESGKQAYASGQYRVAAIAFEQAYSLVQRPAILFSTAQSYRRHYFAARKPQDLRRALALFKQYVATVKRGGRRSHAIGHVSNLEPLWLRIKATMPKLPDKPIQAPTLFLVSSTTPGAKVSLGGATAIAIPASFDVKPGTYKLRVAAPGYFPHEVEELAVKGRMNAVRIHLKPRPAVIAIRARSGAKVSIDGRIQSTTPLTSPLAVSAGDHYLTITRRGHRPFSRELSLKRGEHVSLKVAMKPTGQRRAAYWVGGTGAVLGVGGTVSAILAFVAQREAKDIQRTFAVDEMNIDDDQRATFNNALARRDRWRNVSYLLLGSATLVGISAALLYWVDNPNAEAPRARKNRRIVPVIGNDSIGAGINGQF